MTDNAAGTDPNRPGSASTQPIFDTPAPIKAPPTQKADTQELPKKKRVKLKSVSSDKKKARSMEHPRSESEKLKKSKSNPGATEEPEQKHKSAPTSPTKGKKKKAKSEEAPISEKKPRAVKAQSEDANAAASSAPLEPTKDKKIKGADKTPRDAPVTTEPLPGTPVPPAAGESLSTSTLPPTSLGRNTADIVIPQQSNGGKVGMIGSLLGRSNDSQALSSALREIDQTLIEQGVKKAPAGQKAQFKTKCKRIKSPPGVKSKGMIAQALGKVEKEQTKEEIEQMEQERLEKLEEIDSTQALIEKVQKDAEHVTFREYGQKHFHAGAFYIVISPKRSSSTAESKVDASFRLLNLCKKAEWEMVSNMLRYATKSKYDLSVLDEVSSFMTRSYHILFSLDSMHYWCVYARINSISCNDS